MVVLQEVVMMEGMSRMDLRIHIGGMSEDFGRSFG